MSTVANSVAAGRAAVLYDGHCRFCIASVKLLKKLDWLGRLDYVDMRQDHPLLERLDMSDASFMEQMHVLPPGDAAPLHGFDGIRWLAWRLPGTFALAPFMYIPGVPQLGRRAYLWIARNRFRLVPCQHGVCELPKRPVAQVRR